MTSKDMLQAVREKRQLGECPFCRKPFAVMSVSVSWSDDRKVHDVDEAEIECGGGHRLVMGRQLLADSELRRRLTELLKETDRG